MTQLSLASAASTRAPGAPLSPLAECVAAWAREHGPGAFWELTDALPGVSAGDVDTAAREAGALRWRDGGYQEGRPGAGEE